MLARGMMKWNGKIFLALVVCIFVHGYLRAQEAVVSTEQFTADSNLHQLLKTNDTTVKRNLFYVNNIIITGARKTKSYIIEREITFKRGDSLYLNELVQQFDRARQQLM